jgi:hypothetical protein
MIVQEFRIPLKAKCAIADLQFRFKISEDILYRVMSSALDDDFMQLPSIPRESIYVNWDPEILHIYTRQLIEKYSEVVEKFSFSELRQAVLNNRPFRRIRSLYSQGGLILWIHLTPELEKLSYMEIVDTFYNWYFNKYIIVVEQLDKLAFEDRLLYNYIVYDVVDRSTTLDILEDRIEYLDTKYKELYDFKAYLVRSEKDFEFYHKTSFRNKFIYFSLFVGLKCVYFLKRGFNFVKSVFVRKPVV